MSNLNFEINPCPEDPRIKIIDLKVTEHGRSHSFWTDFDPGAVLHELDAKFDGHSYIFRRPATQLQDAVFGPFLAYWDLIVVISVGIYEAIAVAPDGANPVIIDEDKTKQGLRPARALYIPKGFSWAIRSVVGNRSAFEMFVPLWSEPLELLPRDTPPFTDWYDLEHHPWTRFEHLD